MLEPTKIIRIAILDDGLGFCRLSLHCNCREYMVRGGRIIPFRSERARKDSHGMICSAILSFGQEDRIELLSYRIKEEGKQGNIRDFLLAFEDAVNQNVHLIHLSVGSTEEKDAPCVAAVIQKALRQRILVVAAGANSGEKTFPACLDGVVGVRHSFARLGQKPVRLPENPLGLDIELCCPKTVKGADGVEIPIAYCNSYAAADVTSRIVARLDANLAGYLGLLTKEGIIKAITE